MGGFSFGDVVAILTSLLVCGVAWGSLRQRVLECEQKLDELSSVKTDLARLDERMKAANDKLDVITGSWLFKPPPAYETPPMGRRPRKPQEPPD